MREHYPELFTIMDFEEEVCIKWGRIVTSQFQVFYIFTLDMRIVCILVLMTILLFFLEEARICWAYVSPGQTLIFRV